MHTDIFILDVVFITVFINLLRYGNIRFADIFVLSNKAF